MFNFDVVILTESRYLNPEKVNDYIRNVLTEDELLKTALEELGLIVSRKDWLDQDFDWSSTKSVIFRSTWDYHDDMHKFNMWMDRVESQTTIINPASLIRWNMDKWYLKDLKKLGIRVVETEYLPKGEVRSISQVLDESGWTDAILKPTIASTARHTYKINAENVQSYEETFAELIKKEDLMLQPFQYNVIEKGEVSLVIIDGEYTHAVLKKAKSGDFRVQDDFGGTLHSYTPSLLEIEFAENTVKVCNPIPVYARVDVIWNNENELAISELELIEPELWFRRNKEAVDKLASSIQNIL